MPNWLWRSKKEPERKERGLSGNEIDDALDNDFHPHSSRPRIRLDDELLKELLTWVKNPTPIHACMHALLD